MGRQKRAIGFTRVEERNEKEQTYRMLSELVALQMLDPNRVKELSLQQLEAELERARTENADYLRQCEESGVLPNGVIAGSSAGWARMVEAKIIERKLKHPEFRAQMETELEQVKEQLRQEKEQKGYVDYVDFRTFCLLVEIARQDPQFISQTLDEDLSSALLRTD